MRPLDVSAHLRPSETLTAILDIVITERPAGPAGWNDYTFEFIDASVPAPAIDGDDLVVWFREAEDKQAQTRTGYSVVITCETSLNQHLVFDQRLIVSQTGRAKG